MSSHTSTFMAVEPVGSLLPADMLLRIAAATDVPGISAADYRVVGARSVRDDAERHWDYLRGIWKELRNQLPVAPGMDAPADPTGVAVSQWLEPLFTELGFGRLTAVGTSGLTSDDGTTAFPISHRWNHVPIHLVPWNADLDKRHAGSLPPHSLVQECLNRSDAYLWAVLSNGRRLRLLRDSSAFATISYVEFDLESIFDGELFSEFVLLYRLLHVSRFEIVEGAAPSSCWLEKWRLAAISSGTRALDALSDGVRDAITVLGTGFLQHQSNEDLRRNLDVHAFHAALLRLAYRLIFWFVAEDRDVLHGPDADDETRQRYADYFSSQRLRRLATRYRGTAHSDLYQAVQIVLEGLGAEAGRPELGLPGLGGLYDDAPADGPLRGLSLANHHLLEAVRNLSRVRDQGSRRWRQVDYEHMDSEELGSVYESLLEYVPVHSAVDRTFELVNRLGNNRKTTGSYYTPTALIEKLLDNTLDPVIDDAQKRGEQRAAERGSDATATIVDELLALTVCDPACGSGHFLVAAARRIAKRAAAVREGNPEPTLNGVRHALHEVIARCVYGVDLNPMAVELAKVSLWLEAIEPGKPLSFLDAHIRLGDGLIGATPSLIRVGIPDKAFKAVEGDDPQHALFLERQNAAERAGQASLFEVTTEMRISNATLAEQVRRIARASTDTLAEVHRQASAYETWRSSDDFTRDRFVADAWCAAFFWRKTADAPPAITHHSFKVMRDGDGSEVARAVHDEVVRLRQEHQFFHWHLEFPEIFNVSDDGATTPTGWTGGFSCVLANPPWDKVDFEDKKYFSVVEPAIAEMAGAARKNRIVAWERENPDASGRYRAARRRVKSTFLFASASGVYPLCAKGLTVKGVNSLQTDQLFAERFDALVASKGRVGCIIPTAVATNAGAQHLFSGLTQRGGISVLYDFENRRKIFPGIHASYKFCLLSLTGAGLSEPSAKLAFFLEDTNDIEDNDRIFSLTPEEIALINPNTGTLPVFRVRRDADLTTALYRRFPIVRNELNPAASAWNIRYRRLFDITDDSPLFDSRSHLEQDGWTLTGSVFEKGGSRKLPLYEGRMGHQYNHRFADSDGSRAVSLSDLNDPAFCVLPEKWVAEDVAESRLRERGLGESVAVLAHRRVARNTDERTAIATLLPRNPASYGWIASVGPSTSECTLLLAVYNSFIYDYILRTSLSQPSVPQGVSEQIAVPPTAILSRFGPFIGSRVVELTYTSFDMTAFARDMGDLEMPFAWDEERRAAIRAELDALMFHLYGVARVDADYILETFPIVRRNDEQLHGIYRTKELVLAEYDRMAASGVSLTNPLIDGENYISTLNPPPGHGPRHPAAPTA